MYRNSHMFAFGGDFKVAVQPSASSEVSQLVTPDTASFGNTM